MNETDPNKERNAVIERLFPGPAARRGDTDPLNRIKISEWLKAYISSHEIYDSPGLSAQFTEITGKIPTWPEHSGEETRTAIQARGLGGELEKSAMETMNAFGWEIAESLARNYANWQGTFQQGRGSRFRAAVKALETADV